MKFWMIFIGLFLAPALQAQMPFPFDYRYSPYYPASYYLSPYYPGGPAYYPGAYYPDAYYAGTSYPQLCYFGYPCNLSSTFDADQTINTLSRRVQQLNETVQQLQTQIAAAQTQARDVDRTAPSTERPAEPLTLILKNGNRIVAQGYALMGQSFWILTPGGSQRIALSDLDIEATQTANSSRGELFKRSLK